MIRSPCGHQSQNRPGGLRRHGGRLLVAAVVEPIAIAAFAPAAVRVLNRDQPVRGTAHNRRVEIEAGTVQASEDRPRAIDIIYAPAAEPAAVFFLGPGEMVDGSPDARTVDGFAELREHAD